MPRLTRAALGFASEGETARVHVPHRYLPIILVPGLMGSRLSDPKTGKMAWNPMGIPLGDGPRGFKVDYKRLSQPIPLVADEKHGFKDRAKKQEVKHIRHFNNIVGKFYGLLAKELAAMSGGSFDEFGVKPRVYCCGYDWRQDNARSALRLAEVVEEALAETGEEKVIIVAHSMGGLVSRYYCHALGGERRVHGLILIGSPTLGAPTAFVQLKAGLHGLYVGEAVEAVEAAVNGDADHLVHEVVHVAAGLAGGLAAGVTRGGWVELLQMLYIAMCLGAGKWLSRKETRYFARQLASMYQLMPNGAYCQTNNHWVLFDPLATGHPPTGRMLVLPTMLEGVVGGVAETMGAIGGRAAEEGERLKESVEGALGSGASVRTSERAHRNRVTLEELVEEIAHAASAVGEGDAAKAHEVYELIRELYERADETILHCEPHEHFYRDIYTGLLDVVAERPLCAANLELAFRFEEALTTSGRGGHPSGHGLMKAMLRPLLTMLGVGGSHGEGHGHGGDHHGSGRKVYMHPNTVNIYGGSEQVEAGCALLPTEVLSNDDSNEVHSMLLPFPVGMLGDGTVPAASGNPHASQLSHDFVHREMVSGVAHAELTSHKRVIAFVTRRVDAMVEDFVHGRVPEPRTEEAHDEAGEGSGHEEGGHPPQGGH